MNYQELLTHRRSIRDYQDKDIPTEIIYEILHDACLAPSATNKQPWQFAVINDKTLIKQLSDESKKNLLTDIKADPESPYKRFKTRLEDPNYNVFYNAPSLIIVGGNHDYDWFLQDCSLCVAYLMLAAVERGLGTCWIGLGANIKDKELREKIGLYPDFEIVAPIILGVPKSIPSSTPRNAPVILKANPQT